MILRIKRSLGNFLSLTKQVSKEFKWKQVAEQGMESAEETNIEEGQFKLSLIAFLGDNII